MRQVFACLTGALLAAVGTLGAAGQTPGRTLAPDPIEGTWLGTTGFPGDTVAIGFEFRAAEGGIRAFWYAPVTNFYAVPLDGILEREGTTYRLPAVRMTVALAGDSLVGTYYPLDAPITLRRSPALPGETPLPDLPPGPAPLWSTKLGGSIYAPAAVRDGVAYVGTTAGLLFAVDVASGAPLWSFTAGRPIHGEALVTPDAVFFVCDDGFLYRLERASGRELWRHDMGDARSPRVLAHALERGFDLDVTAPKPLLVDGTLFVGGGDGSFHAVDAANGAARWRFQAAGRIRTTALALGGQVVFGDFAGVLYGLDRASGAEVWRRPVSGEVTSAPALVDGRIVVGTRAGLLAALDTASRATAWRTLFWGSSVESHPVEDDGVVYVGSSNLRRVTAFDPTDGAVLWRTDVYGFAWGRPLPTERLVVIGTAGIAPHPIRHLGSLTALDRRSGRIVWRRPGPICEGCLMDGFVAGAALADDRLVIGGLDGSLHAFPLEHEPRPEDGRERASDRVAAEEPGVLGVVRAFFDAMRARDPAALMETLTPEAVLINPLRRDGTLSARVLAPSELVAMVTGTPEPIDERMPYPSVRVDTDLAHVWGRYTLRVGRRVTNCGRNSFQLVRTPEGWRIAHVASTIEVTGCEGM